METPGYVFFCENCSLPRISKKHTIRITKDGLQIIQDTCETCGSTQQIECYSNDPQKKFRVTDNPDSQIK